jgi:hypothetical protein
VGEKVRGLGGRAQRSATVGGTDGRAAVRRMMPGNRPPLLMIRLFVDVIFYAFD